MTAGGASICRHHHHLLAPYHLLLLLVLIAIAASSSMTQSRNAAATHEGRDGAPGVTPQVVSLGDLVVVTSSSKERLPLVQASRQLR